MQTFYKIFFLLSMITFSGFAGKCRHVEEKVDPFTKAKTRISTAFYQYNFENKFMFSSINDEYFVTYKLVEYGDVDQVFPNNGTIDIAFENGKIIQLKAKQDVAPVTGILNGTVKSYWDIKLPLTREEIETFATSHIVAIRVKGISVQGTNSDPTNKRSQKMVALLANCIICTDCSF